MLVMNLSRKVAVSTLSPILWTSVWYWRSSLSVVLFWMMRAVMGRKGRSSIWTMYSLCPVLVTGLIWNRPRIPLFSISRISKI